MQNSKLIFKNNKMKKQIFLLSILSFVWLLATNINAQTSPQKLAKIEALVDTYVAKYDIPAISLGIVIEGEATFINKGVYDRELDKKIDKQAIFQLGSVSKMLTGVVMSNLVKEGKIDLDESIVSYLPAKLSAKTLDKLRPITVRDLLHHRSGLPRSSKVILKHKKGNDAYLYGYSEADFMNDLDKLKVKPAPGEKFRYSNFGYGLLGYIAERVTEMSYEELLQKYLSQEYSMSNISTKKPTENLVQPYRKDDRRVKTQAWNLGKCTPGGGIFTTTEDMTRLLVQQIEVYAANDTEHPLYSTKSKRPQTGVSYGFGLFDFDNGDYGHSGDLDGFASSYWLRPTEKMGFIYLTSSGGDWTYPLSIEINNILTGRSLSFN